MKAVLSGTEDTYILVLRTHAVVLSGTEDTYILVLRTHAADLVALGTHIYWY
jgi:hypothetical protein